MIVLGPGRVPVSMSALELGALLAAVEWGCLGLGPPAPFSSPPAPGELVSDIDFTVAPTRKGFSSCVIVVSIVCQPKPQPADVKSSLDFLLDLQRSEETSSRVAAMVTETFKSAVEQLVPELLDQERRTDTANQDNDHSDTEETMLNIARTLSAFYQHSSNTDFRRSVLSNLQVSEASSSDEMAQRIASLLRNAVGSGNRVQESIVEDSREDMEDLHQHLDAWSDEEEDMVPDFPD